MRWSSWHGSKRSRAWPRLVTVDNHLMDHDLEPAVVSEVPDCGRRANAASAPHQRCTSAAPALH